MTPAKNLPHRLHVPGQQRGGPFDPARRDSGVRPVELVADHSGPMLDVDFGVGRGLTSDSDDWTVKFILGWGF